MGRTKIPIQGHPKKGGTVKKFMVLLASLLAVLAGYFVVILITNAIQEKPVCVVPVITAQAGDDMWGIAERYCPLGDLRDVVMEISNMNGGESIVPGQVLRLPHISGVANVGEHCTPTGVAGICVTDKPLVTTIP